MERSCVRVPCPLSAAGSLAVGKQQRFSVGSFWEDQDSVLIEESLLIQLTE